MPNFTEKDKSLKVLFLNLVILFDFICHSGFA